ncbi:MAG: winged helix DNA-binding domain-containing protein [Chloroflexi bacterium]|nr:MAG: winged helix DNA-binding domain-containing protein [Chloroflexota bacterium]
MAGQIAARRLRAQRLIGEPFHSAVDAVRWMGAVQSQDYAGGKWALGLRSRAVAAAIDRLFDDGAILRTHVLRPTWHFVVPEDVRWLLDITGPRIRAGLAGRYRDLELDDRVVAHALAASSKP